MTMFNYHINIKRAFRLLVSLIGVLSFGFKSEAQTYVTSPMASTPAAGSYYSNTSIVLNTGFSFTASTGSSLQLYIINSDCVPLVTSPSANQNYIMTSIPKAHAYVVGATGYGTCDVNQTIQYFDGLGRPSQTVSVKASPTDRDIVQPFAYDAYGREAQKFLPYAASSATSDGTYKTTAASDQLAFYQNPVAASAPNVDTTSAPYAQTIFDPSPLNQVLEQGAAGATWQPWTGRSPTYGRTMVTTYTSNTTSTGVFKVKLYTASSIHNDNSRTLNDGGWYGADSLYLTISKDENWVAANGKGGTKEEYKNRDGQVVLKRVWLNDTTPLSTYYVYDDLGNLCFVLPPGTTPDNGNITQTILNNYCYQYLYDGRKRIIQKKIPGRGWDYLVYNAIDQVVATQDSAQRMQSPQQQWTFIKYDAQGREIISGIYLYSGTAGANYRAAIQTAVSGVAKLWETAVATGTGYTNVAWPVSWTGTTLLVNFYDNYNFPGLPSQYTASGVSTMTTGLLTASQTNVLGTSNMLWKVNYYDNLGRDSLIYQQHYLGGVSSVYNYDQETNGYDFTNELISSVRKHYNTTTTNASNPIVTIANTYLYDHEGRKKQTTEQITGGLSVLLVDDEYNEIGQLMTKNLHSTNGGVSYLQSTAYLYNERGWLSKINDPYTAISPTKLFSEQLYYNASPAGHGAAAQFNGNIAAMDYNAGNGGFQHDTYTYDGVNRLMGNTSTAGLTETISSYDNMGNIIGLTRSNNGPNVYGSLAYSYTGNQLTSLTGYRSGTNVYDYNGNLGTDGIRGATLTYNMLNLPQTVSATGVSLTYTYDADGTKLRKVSSTLGTTDYISGIQYKTNSTVIDFIQTEEGRAINTGSSWNYEYTLTDHLGNNRVTFDAASGISTGENDYYPFGLNAPKLVSGTNLYLYNKKELQSEINEYDYGARFYDPVIARWTTIDPMAEKDRRWSPYNYGVDNSIRFIDPDGMETKEWVQKPNINGDGKQFVWDDRVVDQKTAEKYDGKDAKYVGKAATVTSYSPNDLPLDQVQLKSDGTISEQQLVDRSGMMWNKDGIVTNAAGSTFQARQTTGHYVDFTAGFSALGGFGFSTGKITDAVGNSKPFFTFNGNLGVGLAAGFEAGGILPTAKGTQFYVDQYAGSSSTYSGGAFIVGASYGGSIDSNPNISNPDKMNYKNFGLNKGGYTTTGVSLSAGFDFGAMYTNGTTWLGK